MVSESALPERLRWTLAWQTRKLMPALARPEAEERLRDYWLSARRMGEVLSRAQLSEASFCIDVGGGITTPLRWFPGRCVCIDPLAEHYATRFKLPLERVIYAAGQGESLSFLSASSDLMLCTNCIDHTEDPWSVVREVWRVLRPGGWFWFTCEENPSDLERNAGHPHALDRSAIHGLLDGFEIVLTWEEPWRGVYGHLLGHAPHPAMELGFLARKPEVR